METKAGSFPGAFEDKSLLWPKPRPGHCLKRKDSSGNSPRKAMLANFEYVSVTGET